MSNFHLIPYRRSGRGGSFAVSAAAVSALFLAAALFLSSCTGEDTVEVPGPTVTVPGPTTTVEVPATIEGTAGDDPLSGSHIDDTIDGKAGDDTIQGGNGNDTLMGGTGNDEISGGVITAKKEEDALDDQGIAIKKSVPVIGCARGANDGMDGNDIIRGGAGDDKLYGGSDDDKIYGEGGDDLACGNSGDDLLDGGDGDDVLDGGQGDDTIVGGAGDDLVDYSSSPQGITVDLTKPGNIIQDGFYGRDTISGIERIKGSPHDDTLTGDSGANTFMPGAGADKLDGGAGADTLDYSDATISATNSTDAGVVITLAGHSCAPGATDNPATETIITVGGSDNTAVNDTIRAPHTTNKDGTTACLSSIENITGGAGENTLTGDSQDNVLVGGAATDQLTGNAGNDTLRGMGGDDDGGSGGLEGGAGNDMIYGGAGSDELDGGPGNDKLYGEAGDNTYDGGAGDDTFYITATADVDGNGSAGITEGDQTGGGTDTVSFAMYEVKTAPTATVFSYTLEANVENVTGSKYNDSLTGNGLANEIDGGAGKDTLDGGGGNDTLDGGPGNDTLTGGDGNDIFVIMSGEGNDDIADAATGDMIRFKGFAAGTTASYRMVSGGFLIIVSNQSIQVTTALTEADLKKIVTFQ